MHATGVRICLDAIWGNTVETLTCAGYDHGWLRVYTYEDDWQPLLPKGTILRVTGYHDNTPSNKNVAEPRNWTGAGHRAIDNMMIGGVQGVYMSDEEFEAEILKRRQQHHLAEGQRLVGCLLCGTSKPPVKPRVHTDSDDQSGTATMRWDGCEEAPEPGSRGGLFGLRGCPFGGADTAGDYC